MLLCRAMASPEPELPETSARRCPFCGSDQIALRRRSPDGAGLTKVEQRCNACAREFFWFMQGTEPLGEQLPPAPPPAE
jgi:hypothetical protein